MGEVYSRQIVKWAPNLPFLKVAQKEAQAPRHLGNLNVTQVRGSPLITPNEENNPSEFWPLWKRLQL